IAAHPIIRHKRASFVSDYERQISEPASGIGIITAMWILAHNAFESGGGATPGIVSAVIARRVLQPARVVLLSIGLGRLHREKGDHKKGGFALLAARISGGDLLESAGATFAAAAEDRGLQIIDLRSEERR